MGSKLEQLKYLTTSERENDNWRILNCGYYKDHVYNTDELNDFMQLLKYLCRKYKTKLVYFINFPQLKTVDNYYVYLAEFNLVIEK